MYSIIYILYYSMLIYNNAKSMLNKFKSMKIIYNINLI